MAKKEKCEEEGGEEKKNFQFLLGSQKLISLKRFVFSASKMKCRKCE